MRLTASQQDLVLSCRGLALRLAYNFGRRHQHRIPQEELDGAAMEALCKSALSFDPGKGYAFTTYCHRPIRWALSIKAKRWRQSRFYEFTEGVAENIYDYRNPEPEWGSDILQRLRPVLKPEEWDILSRKFCDGTPYAILAAEVGVCKQSMQDRCSRLLKKLRRELGINEVRRITRPLTPTKRQKQITSVTGWKYLRPLHAIILDCLSRGRMSVRKLLEAASARAAEILPGHRPYRMAGIQKASGDLRSMGLIYTHQKHGAIYAITVKASRSRWKDQPS